MSPERVTTLGIVRVIDTVCLPSRPKLMTVGLHIDEVIMLAERFIGPSYRRILLSLPCIAISVGIVKTTVQYCQQ